MGRCTVPPAGWACTRDEGHDGPCAAVPVRAARSEAKKRAVARKRPAERVGAAGGGIVALAYALGVRDPEVLSVLGVVAGAAPGVVTSVIAGGGVVGWARRIAFGDRR